MRIVAGFFGVLFMLAGAAGMALGLVNVPAETYATGDDWSCISVPDSGQRCRHAGDSPQDMVAQSKWVQSGLIIGGALFVGGAALTAGVVASSGRRPVVQTVAPAPTPHGPVRPPQAHAGR